MQLRGRISVVPGGHCSPSAIGVPRPPPRPRPPPAGGCCCAAAALQRITETPNVARTNERMTAPDAVRYGESCHAQKGGGTPGRMKFVPRGSIGMTRLPSANFSAREMDLLNDVDVRVLGSL